MSDYANNHLASRLYLDGFADETGYLTVVRRRTGAAHRAKPKNVGFRNKFWGHDVSLRADTEQRIAAVETAATEVLERIPTEGLPPAGTAERGALMQFVGIHFVRNPDWRDLILNARDAELNRLAHHPHESRWSEETLRSDDWWVDQTLRYASHMAGFLGSMHWSLLRFEEPWILTCDQPVVPYPLLWEGQTGSSEMIPAPDVTAEYRFPIDPHHALILSWLHDVDHLAPRDGNLVMVADINRSIAGRADMEMFHHPSRTPPMEAPPFVSQATCSLISTIIHPGYAPHTGLAAQRRLRAGELLSEQAQRSMGEIRALSVTEPALT